MKIFDTLFVKIESLDLLKRKTTDQDDESKFG